MTNLQLQKLQPIEIWEKIALGVQKFCISNNSDLEKEKNYEIFTKYLNNKNWCLSKEITYQLINDIYNLNCDINYQKAFFLEQIYALKDIKVSKIAYEPFNFPKNIINLSSNKAIYFKSAYTDGIFNIREWEKYGIEKYSILNLDLSTFVIIKVMFKDENRLDDVYAYLKNFNGRYPSIKEIRKFKQASLIEIEKLLYQQKFEEIDRNSISCKEKMKLCLGKKQRNNQYYYE